MQTCTGMEGGLVSRRTRSRMHSLLVAVGGAITISRPSFPLRSDLRKRKGSGRNSANAERNLKHCIEQ